MCLAAAISLLTATACKTVQEPQALPFAEAPAFTITGTTKIPDPWWQAFNDPALAKGIEEVLANNYTLKAAQQQVNALKALTKDARSEGRPKLNARAGSTSTENSQLPEDSTNYTAGLAASWNIDMWGGISSATEAAQFETAAAHAELQATALELSARYARTWYQLAAATEQLNLLQAQTQTNQTIADLLKERFNSGQIRSADVLRQQQLTEATREQTIRTQARIKTLQNQLATLRGEAPQSLTTTAAPTLPALPAMPEAGLPAELVNRRPDVQAAYLGIYAANRELAAAVSDRFPSLSLSAALTDTVENPDRLFSEWIASLSSQLIMPIIDGGERRAEVERTKAVEQQRIMEYAQTVLESFEEVENTLTLETHQKRQIESLEKQLQLSRDTYEQLRTQYNNGMIEYLAVLDALTDTQRIERDLLTAQLTIIETRITLYEALGSNLGNFNQ